MILVLGASGNIGSATVAALKALDADFVAGYRKPAEADAAEKSGVRTTLVDYNDPASLRTAFAGKERVFFVSAANPSLTQTEGYILDAALETGVAHLVKSSVWGAEADDFALAHPHRASEKAIEASAIGYTFIRPNGFFQNLILLAPVVKAQGILPVQIGDAAVSEIDAADIGRAAAAILTTDGHNRKGYTVGGPEAVTNEQKAALLSELTGRTIASVVVPADDWRGMVVGTGMPEWQADGLLDLQRYYIAGKAAALVPTVAELTGTPPRTLRAFLEENRDAFQ